MDENPPSHCLGSIYVHLYTYLLSNYGYYQDIALL